VIRVTASETSSRPQWTRLRERREAAGLSQRDLAALAEVDHVTVWRCETGRVLPNAATLAALARALQVDPRDLADPPQEAA
jgi:transcriptional regulator with XRE-family HTH domain